MDNCNITLVCHPIIPIPYIMSQQSFHPHMVCQHILPLVCYTIHELLLTH
jgi:hypothetical protein